MPLPPTEVVGEVEGHYIQGKETHPKKPPTLINPTENSLRKQFAQTLFVCLLFNRGKWEDNLHEQLQNLFAQILFIGVGGFWGGFPSLAAWRIFSHVSATPRSRDNSIP